MLLVYVYVGILLFSETEPYWNPESNEIAEYFPWFNETCKFCPGNRSTTTTAMKMMCESKKRSKNFLCFRLWRCVRVVSTAKTLWAAQNVDTSQCHFWKTGWHFLSIYLLFSLRDAVWMMINAANSFVLTTQITYRFLSERKIVLIFCTSDFSSNKKDVPAE